MEISQQEILELDKEDWRVTFLSEFYITRLMRKANELGLAGKKIKQVVRAESLFNNAMYIDFICDD